MEPFYFWVFTRRKGNQHLEQSSSDTPMFPAALFTIAKLREQHSYPSVDEWPKKMWFLFIRQDIMRVIIINMIHIIFRGGTLAVRTRDDLGGCATDQKHKGGVTSA